MHAFFFEMQWKLTNLHRGISIYKIIIIDALSQLYSGSAEKD